MTVGACDNGLTASTSIENYAVIQPRCTLISCSIGDSVLIGYNSVVLEGSRVENESIIAPNSVVPPNRIIPSHQLWAGNPVRYIRDLNKKEIAALNLYNKSIVNIQKKYVPEFTCKNSAYLKLPNDLKEIFDHKSIMREYQQYK